MAQVVRWQGLDGHADPSGRELWDMDPGRQERHGFGMALSETNVGCKDRII
jgi:hypothetical protein